MSGVSPRDAAVSVQLDGREIVVTHPAKVLFAQRGETKLDLIGYYEAVRAPLLATMGGRPVLLQRFPHGADGPSFFQKRVPKNAPDWLTTTVVSTPNGTTSRALVAADLAHVAWAVNLGCLGFHVWPSLAESPDVADELRIDLDPELVGYVRALGERGPHVKAEAPQVPRPRDVGQVRRDERA